MTSKIGKPSGGQQDQKKVSRDVVVLLYGLQDEFGNIGRKHLLTAGNSHMGFIAISRMSER